jgi:hypothetical protein
MWALLCSPAAACFVRWGGRQPAILGAKKWGGWGHCVTKYSKAIILSKAADWNFIQLFRLISQRGVCITWPSWILWRCTTTFYKLWVTPPEIHGAQVLLDPDLGSKLCYAPTKSWMLHNFCFAKLLGWATQTPFWAPVTLGLGSGLN